jgi:hypothetical protein
MSFAMAMLMVCGAAHAQVIDCPPTFPLEQSAIASDSKGIVEPSPLSGGGVFVGVLGGRGEMQGDRKKVEGGADFEFGLPTDATKWFVCGYGGAGAIRSRREVAARSRHARCNSAQAPA